MVSLRLSLQHDDSLQFCDEGNMEADANGRSWGGFTSWELRIKGTEEDIGVPRSPSRTQ